MKEFYKNLSLKYKIAGFVLIFIILVMSFTTYFYTYYDLQARKDALQERMNQIAQIIASIRAIEDENKWEKYQGFIEDLPSFNENIVYIAIYDNEGEIRAYVLNENQVEKKINDFGNELPNIEMIKWLEAGWIDPSFRKDFGRKPVIIEGPEGENLGEVRVGFSLIKENQQIERAMLRNLLLFLIFAAGALVASLFLGGRLTKPLTRLTNAMRQVPEGNLKEEVGVVSNDEIGSLTKSYNFMINELREKEFLEQFERDLSKMLTLDKIFNLVMDRLKSQYHISSGVLILNRQNSFVEGSQRGYDDQSISELISLLNNYSDLLDTLETNVVTSNDLGEMQDQRLKNYILNLFYKSGSKLLITLRRQNRFFGVFLLGRRVDELSFSAENKKHISNLLNQSILALENSLLLENLTEQEKYKKEIEIARLVQKNLLPQSDPKFPFFEVFGTCLPAKEVGGDYFDYIRIDEDNYALVIADVSGKGTSAAFYMAEIKGMIVSLADIYKSPKELLKVLNQNLYRNKDKQTFATMIYGVLNTKSKTFTVARAGHNSLILKQGENGSADCVTPNGIGLGLNSGPIFNKVITEVVLHLCENDSILLYTDGISEAMDTNNEEFGEETLLRLFSNMNNKSAREIGNAILDAVYMHSGNVEQHDDITMIVLKGCPE